MLRLMRPVSHNINLINRIEHQLEKHRHSIEYAHKRVIFYCHSNKI